MVAKASSFHSSSAGSRERGLPTETPRVCERIVVAPIVTKVFMTSVIRPLVGYEALNGA